VFGAAHRQPGVEVVDLVLPARQDPFRAAPAAHYAADGLHPNANGYGQWFEQLVLQSRAIQHRLPSARQAPRLQLAHRLFR
jgi:lysophospholipase L1-like esterase